MKKAMQHWFAITIMAVCTVLFSSKGVYAEPVRISLVSSVQCGWNSVYTVNIPRLPQLFLAVDHHGLIPDYRYTLKDESNHQTISELDLKDEDFPLEIKINRMHVTKFMGVGGNTVLTVSSPYMGSTGKRVTGIRLFNDGNDFKVMLTDR